MAEIATLSPDASGLRHLRWAREILASLEAHAAGESLLATEEREALALEAARLRALIGRLSGAVKAYRDFLERTRVGYRGRQRAARFACEQALDRAGELLASDLAAAPSHAEPAAPMNEQCRSAAARLRVLPDFSASARELAEACELAAAVLDRHDDAYARMEDEQRRPLKLALHAAKGELREGLSQMSARIEARLPATLLLALYPPLARGSTLVADDGDLDDDAAAAPDPL